MPESQSAPSARPQQRSPFAVAMAGWIVPGAGYWLLGEKCRGLTVGITVLLLFIAGLLVGGIRVLEVPGYGTHGKPIMLNDRDDGEGRVWVLRVHPLDEVRDKPWSIAQVMMGPISVVSAYGSIAAAQLSDDTGLPIGAKSHSRVNEIGVLYTAVAGMLNLLAIIDAAHRVAREPTP